MKLFRIKEEYLITQWTYVKADSKEEAIDKLYKDEHYREVEIENEHHQTYWNSLEELVDTTKFQQENERLIKETKIILHKKFKKGDEVICIKDIPDTNIIKGDPFIVKEVMCIYEDLPATNLIIKKSINLFSSEIVDIIKYSEYFKHFSEWKIGSKVDE